MKPPHRNAPVSDQRGMAKQLKRVLPPGVFRAATLVFNACMAALPDGLKYGVGAALRRGKAPYSLLRPGDVVVQVGAPRDLLAAGRSRAVHFARFVGPTGRVLVVEPDPANVAALCAFLERRGLSDRVRLFDCGAWNKPGELVFLSNPRHPAANVLSDVLTLDDRQRREQGFVEVRVPVRTLDDILAEAGVEVPRLVSITTNGAELRILEGMPFTLARRPEFVSLASTGPGYQEVMQALGYEYFVRDDRGYCFRRATGGR